MTWFEELTGIAEASPQQVRSELRVDGRFLESITSRKRWRCGELEIPSLAELRQQTADLSFSESGPMTVREIVADVQQLHQESAYNGALFQVASQFNLLEMVGPGVTPEKGVGGYQYDRTQGPACAIACGAATIYRNYFAEIDGQRGQSAACQIDAARELGEALGNRDGQIWEMQNGYALASGTGLESVNATLAALDEAGRDALRAKLRIGVHWQAGVTLNNSENVVSQAFCSAMPVAYSQQSSRSWEALATLVLEASYEATLHAALRNRAVTGSNQVLLTLLGGGAFGNRTEWILGAIRRALDVMVGSGLEINVVSYGSPMAELQGLLREFGGM